MTKSATKKCILMTKSATKKCKSFQNSITNLPVFGRMDDNHVRNCTLLRPTLDPLSRYASGIDWVSIGY